MSSSHPANSAHPGNDVGSATAGTLKRGLNVVQGAGEMIRENINGFADTVTNSDPKNAHSTDQQHHNQMHSNQNQDSSMSAGNPAVHGQSLDSQAPKMPQQSNLGAEDSRR